MTSTPIPIQQPRIIEKIHNHTLISLGNYPNSYLLVYLDMDNLHNVYEWLGESVEGINHLSGVISGQDEASLRLIGLYVACGYVICVFLIVIGRLYYRVSNSPGKTLLACALDTLLDVPALLQIGPWGRDNGIEGALESSMKETSLCDFGTDSNG